MVSMAQLDNNSQHRGNQHQHTTSQTTAVNWLHWAHPSHRSTQQHMLVVTLAPQLHGTRGQHTLSQSEPNNTTTQEHNNCLSASCTMMAQHSSMRRPHRQTTQLEADCTSGNTWDTSHRRVWCSTGTSSASEISRTSGWPTGAPKTRMHTVRGWVAHRSHNSQHASTRVDTLLLQHAAELRTTGGSTPS